MVTNATDAALDAILTVQLSPHEATPRRRARRPPHRSRRGQQQGQGREALHRGPEAPRGALRLHREGHGGRGEGTSAARRQDAAPRRRRPLRHGSRRWRHGQQRCGPLLEPQWKDPKKWWKELATAKGKKDYDWSHLAARYFPARVRDKCHTDPSLAVAHKCFWELHPAKAYAWELRLQDEIRPDFTIDEPGSDAARAAFLADHAQGAADLRAAEHKRRARKAAKADEASDQQDLALADPADPADPADAEDAPDADD